MILLGEHQVVNWRPYCVYYKIT